MAGFVLDRRLERDTHPVTELGLCEVRLMDNRNFPWLVLVPMVAGASEWIDLEREQQHLLSDEIMIASHLLRALVTPDKLNVATLGNQVSQLHLHVIARYTTDAAWPNPVWGGASAAYGKEELEKFLYELRVAFDSIG